MPVKKAKIIWQRENFRCHISEKKISRKVFNSEFGRDEANVLC